MAVLGSGLRRAARRVVKRGGHDPAVPQDAEKALAARIAPVGREIQEALQYQHGSVVDAFPRNVLEIKISALGTMGVLREGHGYAVGAVAVVAGVASPGFEIDQ